MGGGITQLIDSLRKNGINVNFCEENLTDNGEILSGLESGKGVFCDTKAQKTYFYADYAGERYTLWVPGAAKEQYNYALIISALTNNMDYSLPQNLSLHDKLKLLILGSLSGAQKSAMLNDFARNKINHFFIVFTVKQRKKTAELREFLENICTGDDILITADEHTIVFLKAAHESGYSSAYDFAKIIYENIKEELSVEVTVCDGGIVKDADELNFAYEKAVFTLKYGKILSHGSEVLSYKNYVLVKILSELPRATLSNSLSLLTDKNIDNVLADSELTLTAEKFMENSLNISETSRNMYIHRNTLIYRLDKIESETGLNLRNFGDADVFRLIEILKTLVSES